MVMRIVQFQLLWILQRPSFYIFAAIFTGLMALACNQFIFNYLEKLSYNNHSLAISSHVIAPLNSLALILITLVTGWFISQLKPKRIANGIDVFLTATKLSKQQWLVIDWLTQLAIFSLLSLLYGLILIPVIIGTEIDSNTLLLQIVSLFWFGLFFCSIQLIIQHTSKSPLVAFSILILLLIFLFLTQLALSFAPHDLATIFSAFSPLQWFSYFNLGIISLYYLVVQVILTAWVFSFIRPLPFQALSRSALLIFFIISILFASDLSKHRIDSTSNQRFSLIPVLQQAISTLSDSQQSPEPSFQASLTTFGLTKEERQEVLLRLTMPLQDQLSQLKIKHLDHPKAFQQQLQSGIELQLQGQTIWLTFPFSDAPQLSLLQAIQTVIHRNNQWIVFSEGHSELSIADNSSLSEWLNGLRRNGFNLINRSFSDPSPTSDNTSLVVIANSQTEWEPSEQTQLLKFLLNGGSLLWLRNPNDASMYWLEDFLQLSKLPGTLIDPVGFNQGTPHPAVLLLRNFESHPITDSMQTLVALPWSAALSSSQTQNNQKWQQIPLANTHAKVWTEFSIEQEELKLDESEGELQGSFTPIWLLKPKANTEQNGQQKIAVVGDTEFLANGSIANYDNRKLAHNLVLWLTQTQLDSALPSLTAIDKNFQLNSINQAWLGWFNILLVPFLLLLMGVIQWRNQRT